MNVGVVIKLMVSKIRMHFNIIESTINKKHSGKSGSGNEFVSIRAAQSNCVRPTT